MKIANSEQTIAFKENEDLYKRMNKSLDRKIANKEQEIKQVDSLYDQKVEAAKSEGEDKYMQSLDRNQQRIIGQSNEFEEKIKGYQDRLKKARETVTAEETTVKDAHKTRLDDMKLQMEENFQDQFAQTQENTRDLQSSTQNVIKEIVSKSKSEKAAIQSNAQYEINALSSDMNAKGTNIEKTFRDQLDQNVRTHNAEVDLQRNELKKVAAVEIAKDKRLSDEKTRVNQEQLIFQDKHQQEMLKQRDADFKIRYENMAKEHDSILKELSTKLDADVKKMVEKTSTQKKILEGRTVDPFYHVDKLEPKMVEDLKTVTISMPIAEYEKENVHLSTQGRLVKITLSRKYTDSLKGEDGSMNRSTRSELFSKELATADILNPRDIVQSYQDGILSFQIKKA